MKVNSVILKGIRTLNIGIFFVNRVFPVISVVLVLREGKPFSLFQFRLVSLSQWNLK